MKKKFKIAVLPGDGIGPEVMAQALKLLDKVASRYDLSYETQTGWIGGSAIDKWGDPLPKKTRQICLDADAVLLGSIGGPRWDHLPADKRPETGGLLPLRKMLNLYANIRPIVLYRELQEISPLSFAKISGKIDLVTVRELAQGIYFGEPKFINDQEGMDTMRYRREDVEKIAHTAFTIARKRKKKVTSVDKANVLRSSMLWRKVVTEISIRYPDVQLNHLYVDNAAMQLVLNPRQFDVILTTNLFGDILSDQSAALCGSLGMLPSASLGNRVHLYEPAGGSAPDIAGKNIANPIAMILSVAMMLDYTFGKTQAAEKITRAVECTVKEGYLTADITKPDVRPVSTTRMAEEIMRRC